MLIEPIIVIDFETTGLDPRQARLTEVAALRIEGDRITARFETLIDAGVQVPASITDLTGISTDMLRSAPKVAEVIPALRRFIGGCPVVAHHGSFDQKFYEHELRRRRMRSYSNDFLCTVRLARRVLPGLHSYALAALARQCGTPFLGAAHRATADAEVTAGVLLQLTGRIRLHGAGEISAELLRQVMRWPIRDYRARLARLVHGRPATIDIPDVAGLPGLVLAPATPSADLPVGWVYRSTLEPRLDLAVAETIARKLPTGRSR